MGVLTYLVLGTPEEVRAKGRAIGSLLHFRCNDVDIYDLTRLRDLLAETSGPPVPADGATPHGDPIILACPSGLIDLLRTLKDAELETKGRSWAESCFSNRPEELVLTLLRGLRGFAQKAGVKAEFVQVWTAAEA